MQLIQLRQINQYIIYYQSNNPQMSFYKFLYLKALKEAGIKQESGKEFQIRIVR